MNEVIAKWIMPLMLAMLAPIYPLMGAVGVLIAADLVTGILAARKRGEAITSRAMSRTITKALVYQLAVISAFALEGLVGLPVAKLIAAVIGLVEFKSLAENVKAITGVDLKQVIAKISSQKREE